MITANSFFSGAGIFDLGFKMQDIDIKQSFEIDPIAVQSQKLNYGHDILQSDITKQTALDTEDTNIIIGTYPCQNYSTAANIHHTRYGSDLFAHFFRIISLKQPDCFVIENVPGMKKFPVVMEAFKHIKNYYTYIFCPINSNIWLPQERKRLIILGTKKYFNWNAPISNNQPIKLKEILEKNPKVTITKSIISRLNGVYRDLPIISDPEKNDIAPTCLSHYSRDRSTRLLVDKINSPLGYRPYTIIEYRRLQGIPDFYRLSGTENEQFRMVGNGVPVNFGIWLAKEIKRYFKLN